MRMCFFFKYPVTVAWYIFMKTYLKATPLLSNDVRPARV